MSDKPKADTTVASICQQIRADLLGEHDECLEHGERHATEAALATCERIARYIGVAWFETPGLKWAAFGDGTGEASFNLHRNGRQLDFQVSADGERVMCHCIDEQSRPTSRELSIDESGEMAAWVCNAP